MALEAAYLTVPVAVDLGLAETEAVEVVGRQCQLGPDHRSVYDLSYERSSGPDPAAW